MDGPAERRTSQQDELAARVAELIARVDRLIEQREAEITRLRGKRDAR
jgi:hypothetical protein